MSEQLLSKVLLGLKFVVGILGVILFIVILTGEKTSETGESLHNLGAIDGGIMLATYTFLLCIGIWLVFGVLNIVTNIKKSIPLLISVTIFLIIFGIAYSMASDEIMETWKKKPDLFTPGNIKWSDVGIYTMYSMIFITVGAILYGEISKIFK